MADDLPPVESIPLKFLRDGRRQFCARCPRCAGAQPIYPVELMAKHGRTKTLADIADTIPCLFCDSVGLEIIEHKT